MQPQRSNMNVSERYDRDLGPPQHVLDATQGLLEHRLANKLWSSADDDRRRADVLVDGSYARAAGVARIGLWRSHQAFYGTFYGVFYGIPAPNRCLAQNQPAAGVACAWRPIERPRPNALP